MKKFMLFAFLIVSGFTFSAQARIVDCPLKNLKKNQLRGADGTAYIPASISSAQQSSAPRVNRGN